MFIYLFISLYNFITYRHYWNIHKVVD